MAIILMLGAGLVGCAGRGEAAEAGAGEVYSVVEIPFAGPAFGPADTPARDVEFWVRFRHESGAPEYRVLGFWDGDGKGGSTGNAFRVRFCPTKPGRWTLAEVHSNRKGLAGQHQGDWITARASQNKGFWEVDTESPGRRWYRRSDGSHAYIYGNTMYSFVSEQCDTGPSGSSIAADVRANAEYFKKLRFSVHGDRYVHPTEKPFFDDAGKPTDDGNFSLRPNPAWFHQRVDVAVSTAFVCDSIADIILNGPDTADSRAILRAGANGGDAGPFLRTMAARYGSYPNVWFCLANEWNIKQPKLTAEEVRQRGGVLRASLPYPTPISIHAVRDWDPELNAGPWNDHVILQNKLKRLPQAADAIARNYAIGGSDRPVIDDELAYEGAGDGWSEEDVVDAMLGAFLGGGYASTGYKPANKKGHYFWGRFRADEHTAADNLKWLRERIDAETSFWRMAPVAPQASIFAGAGESARAMEWAGREYVLGTDEAHTGIRAALPEGTWRIVRLDAIAMQERVLAEGAKGPFTFDAPASRAVLFVFRRK